MKLSFILDGMTVQSVGELVQDIETTRRVRGGSAWNYARSFEEFCVAYLFGETIMSSSNMPKVGDERPGDILVKRLGRKVESLLENPKGNPSLMLTFLESREMIKLWLRQLNALQPAELIWWKRYIAREASAYLRPYGHVSGSLQFGKTNIMTDRELEATISEGVARGLTDVVLANDDRVPRNIAEEFVRRTVISHIAIFQWFLEIRSINQSHSSILIYQPHITRSLLVSQTPGNGLYRQLVHLITPKLTTLVLQKARHRNEVISALEEIGTSSLLREIRPDIANAFFAKDAGKLRHLCNRIERRLARISSAGQERSLITFRQIRPTFESAFKLFGEVADNISRKVLEHRAEERASDPFLRALAHNSFDYNRQYVESLVQVFPELQGGFNENRTK